MIILFCAVILFFGMKAAPRGTFFEDCFSVAHTRALKGLFAIIVMFHHLYAYLVNDFYTLTVFKNVGYLMVGGFFLISGYGLMWGVLHKKDYLKGFFRKRILAIVIPYYIIDLGYIFINHYNMKGNPERFATFVKESLMGLQMWFVPVMVLLYVLFRISFIGYSRYTGRHPKLSLIAPILLSLLVIVYVVGFYATQRAGINVLYGRYWNNTALCFVLGIWYSIAKDKIFPFIKKLYYPITAVVLVAFVLLFGKVCKNLKLGVGSWTMLLLEVVSALVFCALVLLLCMKLKPGNGILNVCGDLSFEIYMSHAIFITLFRWGRTLTFTLGDSVINYTLFVEKSDLYLLAILIASFLFSFVIHQICRFILKLIQKSIGFNPLKLLKKVK